MSTELAALRSGLAPRRSAVGSLLALPVADVAAMLACFVAGGLLNFSFQNVTEERTLILALLIAGSLVVFQHFGHYSRRRQFWQELGDIAMVAAGALLFDLALLYLLKVNFSRLWVLTSWALVVPAVPLARLLVKKVALELGHWLQPTVIVGVGPNALEIAAAYDARNNHLGYQVQAFLDPCGAGEAAALDQAAGERWLKVGGREIPVLPLDARAKELPGWLGQPHVVVALELDEMLGREGLIESLSFYHGDIDVISPLKGLPINNTRVSHFFSRDILSLRIHNNLARPWPQLVKRAFDLVAASRAAPVPGALAGAGGAQDPAGGRRRGDLRPHPGRAARAAVPVLQVPHHGGELGRGAGRAVGARSGGPGGMGPGPQAAL